MNDIIRFFEKPGCLTNRQQKALLQTSGYRLHVQSLLTQSWRAEELRQFFRVMPVKEWFNPSAPRIKNGEIDPEVIDEHQAIAVMLADPLLIRRPLIEYRGKFMCGFDEERLALQLGIILLDVEDASPQQGSLEACSGNISQACPDIPAVNSMVKDNQVNRRRP